MNNVLQTIINSLQLADANAQSLLENLCLDLIRENSRIEEIRNRFNSSTTQITEDAVAQLEDTMAGILSTLGSLLADPDSNLTDNLTALYDNLDSLILDINSVVSML